jgi:hypothetical protein
MTEQANLHTDAVKAAYEAENGDIADEGHVTSNDVSLNDYPGKAEALVAGEASRAATKEVVPPEPPEAEAKEAEPKGDRKGG